MNQRNYSCGTSFLDLLFNMLLAFVALFVLSFALIQTQSNKNNNNAEVKAEFLVTVTWSGEIDADVDTYVEDPLGNLVFFRAREVQLMNLERDDVGFANDVIQTSSGPVKYKENIES